MIDSLTRRVRQLEDDILRQAQVQRKELANVMNQRDAYKREAKKLAKKLARAEQRAERLVNRKHELKAGLKVVIAQRDLLQTEKDALRAELIETRRVRDGYLTDRETLSSVLAVVRSMREKLLVVHRDTEKALTKDANELHSVVQACLVNLNELHEEILQKKALSTGNESLADEFEEKMALRLRAIVASVGEFKSNQDLEYSAITSLISNLRTAREHESATLHKDLGIFSVSTINTLSELQDHAKALNANMKSQSQKRREAAQRHREELVTGLEALKSKMLQATTEVRTHASTLDGNLTQWADLVKSRLAEAESSAKTFVEQVNKGLATIQAQLDAASNAQLDRLAKHTNALTAHLEHERKTITTESDKLVADVSAYLTKLMLEYSNANIRRQEVAVEGFNADTAAMAAATRELVASQRQTTADETLKAHAWSDNNSKYAKESQEQNQAQRSTAAGVLQLAVQVTKRADLTLTDNVQGLTSTVSSHQTQAEAACKQSDDTIEQATADTVRIVAQGTADITKSTETIQGKVKTFAAEFENASDVLEGKLGHTLSGVHSHVEQNHRDIHASEAATTHYVKQEIKRDTKPLPPKKPYTYPTQYASTPAYEKILSTDSVAWQREHGINTKAINPGKPTDFPGEKGSEDLSGIIAATAPKPLPANDAAAYSKATAESEPEVEVNDDADDDQEQVEPAHKFEEEELVFNPHDLGEEIDTFRVSEAGFL